jgi:hypothetical protein
MSAHPPQGGGTRPLASLTIDEVCRLLSFLELGKAAEMFRDADFNGEALAAATDQDLQDVGMKLTVNRARLLNRVKELVANGVPAKAIGCCPSSWCLLLSAPTHPCRAPCP